MGILQEILNNNVDNSYFKNKIHINLITEKRYIAITGKYGTLIVSPDKLLQLAEIEYKQIGGDK